MRAVQQDAAAVAAQRCGVGAWYHLAASIGASTRLRQRWAAQLSIDPLGRVEVVVKIDLAESDEAILACFPVIRHLRDLQDTTYFLRRVRSQQLSGYQLVALRDGGDPVAVAGFRLGESLAWGRHLYIDDLVTLPEARSRGYGAALLTWLAEFGRAQGVGQLHLDSGKQRVDAHRFYEREGLEGSSIHFKRAL